MWPVTPSAVTMHGMRSERRRGVLRGLLVLAAVGGWLAVGAVGGPAQGSLSSVQTNDAAAFLPASAESTRAAGLARGFVDTETLPAVLVATSDDGGALSPDQLGALGRLAEELPDATLPGTLAGEPATLGEVLAAEPVLVPSEDGEAAVVVVPLDAEAIEASVGEESEGLTLVAVEAMRAQAAGDAVRDAGLTVLVTGAAGFVADLVGAFGAIDVVLLLVALGAVLVILGIVYRSPILPFVVISCAVLALCLAGLVVYELAARGVLTLNGQSQGILSILVVGAAVDYSLLLVARYREELHHHRSPATALRRAVRASIEPIAASAGTVVAGLLCLLLSDLASNRSLGPVAGIGIVAAFLASTTLLPALLLAAGKRSRSLFWPRMPRYDGGTPGHGASPAEERGVWARVARAVGRRPRRTWVVTLLALLAAAAFVPRLDASGTGEDEVFLAQADSVDGEAVLREHFAGFSAQPAIVVAPEESLGAVVDAAAGVDGVAAAVPVTAGGAPVPGAPARGEPLVVDGRVRVDVTTSDPSDSQEAVETVAALREAVRDVEPDAVVGGAAAERLDTQRAGQRDLAVIVPAVLGVILLILVLLLRSVLAPVLILLANVLSFGAALGVSALVFEHVLGFPGADPAVPLYGFCFLVALGVDYTIFLMTRVREETVRLGTRAGVLRALAVTGSVITSAGVVLAATFAALGVVPLLFLAQLAFVVAFGVLLDTFVVRSLLVPALVHDVGPRVWWPGRPDPAMVSPSAAARPGRSRAPRSSPRTPRG
ncbi:RND superfamily putative drug exporter [Isoptericola variabilis J7]|uniref:MMPL domain protein n=2 Tax=Isoptericola TaxID=254250 RepID=F6FX02_ISOV2|nr:MMPL domain protein [Isoptericola variabilis 225]TWH28195.1 RND superfamily putative drug exporter [Isoptericola variabilis J7]